jgi:hypothetical protein
MLGCDNTRFYELLNSKELDSYLDGRSRKITVESIHRYIARKLSAASASGVAAEAPHPRRPHRKQSSSARAPAIEASNRALGRRHD